jgi:electron transfer flavoprotein beta subunit
MLGSVILNGLTTQLPMWRVVSEESRPGISRAANMEARREIPATSFRKEPDMRIVVCVKHVYDPKTVKISRSREELDLRDAVKIFNPPDKYALEAALRLREAAGGEVIALTVGGSEAEDVAHEAIAIGADKGILVTGGPASTPAMQAVQLLASNIVTSLLAAAIGRLGADLVLTGHAGLTDGAGSLAPRLAAALDWPVLIDVARLDADAGSLSAIVAGANDGEAAPVPTPAVIAILPGSERPRYPHPARIANAWNDGVVEVWTATDLGLADLAPDTEIGGLILGPERVRGQVIKGSVQEAAAELAGVLRARRLV